MKQLKIPIILFFSFFLIMLTGVQDANAQHLGKLDFTVKRSTASGIVNFNNLNLSVSSTKDNDYKWSRASDSSCHGCRTASVVESWASKNYTGTWSGTTSGGKASFGDGSESGLACGNSGAICTVNKGNCNPFKLTADAGSQYLAESKWVIKVYGTTYERSGRYLDFNFLIANDSNTVFDITFYGVEEYDNLEAKMKCNPTNPPAMVCEDSRTINCEFYDIEHSSNPSHTGYQYKYKVELEGRNWTSYSSTNPGLTITYDELKNKFNSEGETIKVKIKGQMKCGGGKETGIKEKEITFTRGTHKVECRELDAIPLSGQIPLTVDFTANLWDNHTCSNVASAKYFWNFNSPGAPSTWDRETTSNKTNYTYTAKDSFRAWFKGDVAGVVSESCPVSSLIDTEKWTESQYQEIAP